MRKRYTGKEAAPLNVQNAKPHVEPRTMPREIQNESAHMIQNGLNQDILGFTPGAGFGSQLSQVDTLFQNNRWYLVSNMRQLLCEIYVEHGIVQRVVDMPVDDALRGGIIIKSKQLSEDQVQQVRVYMDRQNDIANMGQTMKWNRLFGGAGLVMITGKDPREPLNIASLHEDSPFELRPSDMWELFSDRLNIEGYMPEMLNPSFEYYTYYGRPLHKSHVMPMKGLIAPSFIRPRLRGWGFSVVEALVRSINQYLKATDLSFEVMDEFKLDVYKFKGLVNTLGSPQAATKVRERVDLANRGKNYQNAIVLDSEDDYDHKQLSFSGLAETMNGIRMQLASDMCMPMSKLFGISSTGFSSGEDDIENYNAMVESQVRQKCKYDFVKLVEIRCQMLFGFIPEDLEIEFKPLRVLGAEAEENVKTQKFNRVLAALTAGAISPEQFQDACNRDNLLGVQLEATDLLDIAGEDDDSDDDDPGATDKENPKPPAAKAAAKSTTTAKDAPAAKNAIKNEGWVTMHGTHVYIGKDGEVAKGPTAIKKAHSGGNEIKLKGYHDNPKVETTEADDAFRTTVTYTAKGAGLPASRDHQDKEWAMAGQHAKKHGLDGFNGTAEGYDKGTNRAQFEFSYMHRKPKKG